MSLRYFPPSIGFLPTRLLLPVGLWRQPCPLLPLLSCSARLAQSEQDWRHKLLQRLSVPGFIIGIQLGAIASFGSISRLEFLQSEWVVSITPSIESWFWIPAKAAMGETVPLLITVIGAGFLLAGAIAIFAGKFSEHVLAAAGVSFIRATHSPSRRNFKPRSISASLRHKEWKLLLRDHWLLSQTLMQILYLLPPAIHAVAGLWPTQHAWNCRRSGSW